MLYTVGGGDVDLEKLLIELTRLAILEPVTIIRTYILRQVALLVNRSPVPEGLSGSFRIMQDPLGASQLYTYATPSTDVTPVVFWIAKALSFRLSRTQEVLEHVLGLLSNKLHGSASARGFGTLLAPDEILSKEHGAVIRLLARQKVFSICVPRIATGFKAAENITRPNYLIALSGILKYVPTEVMMTEIATLLPLLLQSLDLRDQEVKAATIKSLLVISQESPAAVEAHTATLTHRLLRSAVDTKENIVVSFSRNLVCRFQALNCGSRKFDITPYDAYRYSLVRSRTACCCHSELSS